MYFYIFIAAGRLFDEIDVIYTLNEILKLQAVQKYFKIIKKYIIIILVQDSELFSSGFPIIQGYFQLTKGVIPSLETLKFS